MARNRTRRTRRAWGIAAWVAAALIGWGAGGDLAGAQSRGSAASGPLKPDALVSLDFDDADIRVVIKHISDLTGRNFLVDEKVRGRVTIITPRKIRARDLFNVFQTLLQTYGFTTVRAGEVTKIIPLREVTRSGLPTLRTQEPEKIVSQDRFMTTILRVLHADVTRLQSLLRPFVAREGNLTAYGPANTLVITDTARNVRRLIKIIKTVDTPPAEAQVAVVRLNYAPVKQIAATLEKLAETVVQARETGTRAARRTGRRGVRATARKQAKKIHIIPEERINALVLVAPSREMVQLRRLIKNLDTPAPLERGRIHVYRLENAVAEDLAQTLSQQIQKASTTRRSTGTARETSSRAGAGFSLSGGAPSETSRSGAARSGAAGAPLLEGVVITPDKATNSLVVRASAEDFKALSQVIRKLDVPRAQVLVEALIAEMTLDKTREVGVEWRLLQPKRGSTRPFGGTNLPVPGASQGALNSLGTAPFTGPTGLAIGVARGFIRFGDQDFLDVRGLVRAFQADSDINILSTPQILTTDNEEAEIIVGENRPFLTRDQTSPEGSVLRTFEFRDLGVKLRITPHISPNRFVRLKIFQEVLNFVSESSVGAVTTTKRQATTTVTVEDGQTVVIGGLIRDDITDSDSKVPFLGDIPLVGPLFKVEQKKKIKTNLLIFITPRIVTTPEEHRQLTERKKKETGTGARKPASTKDRL